MLRALLPVFSFFSSFGQLEFVENKGQWPGPVDFRSDFPAGSFFIERKGFTVMLHDPADLRKLSDIMHPVTSVKEQETQFAVHSFSYRVAFQGASPVDAAETERPLNTYNNYFLGDDPARWASGCKLFGSVLYRNVYPQIDLRYYSDAGTLKYDFIIHPGGDPSVIRMLYEGPVSLKLSGKDLLIKTPVGEVKELFPYSYQPGEGNRSAVNTRFLLRGNSVSFSVEGYDPSRVLVIDPTVIFSSFTGSSTDNWGYTATPGRDGSFFAAGISFGIGYPTSPGAFQTNFNGGSQEDGWSGYDIAIFKFSPNGSRRLYATYLGGSGNEQPHSMIVDSRDNLIVAGRSFSDNFPKQGLGQVGPGGAFDIILTKFSGDGTGLIGSVKIGGTGNDGVNVRNKYQSPGPDGLRRNYGDDARSEVIVDANDNIILASCTQSADFPVTGAALNPGGTYGGGRQDGVILRFNSNLSSRSISAFLGGSGEDACFVTSIHPVTGNIYIAGGTTSNNFPGDKSGVLAGGGSYNGGIADGYVSILNPAGNALIKTTYLGTSGIDIVYGLKFDKGGFPYVMGTTTGSWPVINASFSNPGSRQFISKLRPDLSAYVYSTVFGTAASQPNISPVAFLVDRCENVYVSGWGGGINNNQGYSSGNTRGMPAVNPLGPAFAPNDGQDFYFFVMERDARRQLFGTSFGQNGGLGDHVDGGTSRFDENGVIYQAMCANCGRNVIFPTTPGVWSSTNASNNCNEAAVKIEMNFSGVSANVQSSINSVRGRNKACVPFTVFFTDSLRKAEKYYWDFGNGFRDTTTTASDTFRYTMPGAYLVMMIAEDSSTCNIRDTSYLWIYAGNNRANLDFSFRKLPPCQNLTVEFTNLSSAPFGGQFGPASFVWNFGDNSPEVTAGLTTPVSHTYAGPGSYTVTLRMTDTSFCNYPDQITKTIRISSLVEASFNTSAVGCIPYEALFENTSTGGTEFIWDFGDGPPYSDPSVWVRHTYNDTGTFRIRLIATDTNTCNRVDTSDYREIQVLNGPQALFSWAPNPPQSNTPVQFTNLSQGAVRYLWYFGDGDSSNEKDPEHLYLQTGNYSAMLIVFNAAGCPDTFSLSVSVIIDPLLDVPNAFTPGRFGSNSVIFVKGFGISRMVWKIYNRWGQLIFESNSPASGWDGTYKGKLQPMDVYTYTLEAELSSGTRVRKTGDITLIR